MICLVTRNEEGAARAWDVFRVECVRLYRAVLIAADSLDHTIFPAGLVHDPKVYHSHDDVLYAAEDDPAGTAGVGVRSSV